MDTRSLTRQRKTEASGSAGSVGRRSQQPEAAPGGQLVGERQRQLGELGSEITLYRYVDQSLTDSNLFTASDREIQSHPTYFDNGIQEVIYHGEEHFAEVVYADGDSIIVETADVRSQAQVADKYRGGNVFFGSAPDDLIEPEVPSD